MKTLNLRHSLWALACAVAVLARTAEAPPRGGPDGGPPGPGGPDGPPFGPGGLGMVGPGPGGFGGGQEKQKLVEKFDRDGDHRLNATERKAAREFIQKERAEGRGRRGPGGPGGGRGGFGGREENPEPAKPGRRLTPADVKSFPDAALYDAGTLRTIFLEFEDTDWEKELAEFKNTDVEVPAKVTIDGKTYADVGVHFRGMSSFMMVGEGRKRSLNLSFDFVHHDQQVGGYRTVELLNAHEDPTFLRSVLSYQIERDYVPAPKANLARVVINGESWGVYVNAQPFNKDFVRDWFGTTKGARWKVPGSPGGQGSLKYLGEDAAAYKRIYQIKTKDDTKSWAELIRLCKVLNETPADPLEEALAPLLDVDGALKFLALENVLINNDGYWIRSSDYSIYQDPAGHFHIFPHDSNETFLKPEGGGGRGGFDAGNAFGPGLFAALDTDKDNSLSGAELRQTFARWFGEWDPNKKGLLDREELRDGLNAALPRPDFAGFGGRGGAPGSAGPGFGGPEMRNRPNVKGVELDPLVAANDPTKPLLSKLLAVPALRTRYLGYVRDIADKWLDWEKLGPLARQYQSLIAEDVKADTRKLYSAEAFVKGLSDESGADGGPGGGRHTISLKSFADQRRAFLLKSAPVKNGGS